MSADLSSAVSESEADAWRNFCYNEHPLQAATSAMLNLGGVHAHSIHEEQNVTLTNSSAIGSVYETNYGAYGKNLSNPHSHPHPHPPPAPTPVPPNHADKDEHPANKSGVVQELWPGSSSGAGKNARVELATGGVVVSAHASSSSSAPVSAASATDAAMEAAYGPHVKKEPEDLTHRRGHCHPASDSASKVSQVHSSVISRALANGELVVTTLDSLNHAAVQMGSLGDSDVHSPTSPALHLRRPLADDGDALDLARVGMQQHYPSAGQSVAFAAPPGLTPIQPVHDYDAPATYDVLSPVAGAHRAYTTINHGAIRQSNGNSIYAPVGGSAANSGANSSGDYYRDYFSAADQYSSIRPSSQLAAIYAAADPHGDGGGAFANERGTCGAIRTIQSGVYKQQGTGLSVDLPSPDSGIGTDAVTPRDQSVVQQNFDYTELCNSGCNGLMTDQSAHGHNSTMDAAGAAVANGHAVGSGHGHHHHPHGGPHVTGDHSTDGSRTPTMTPTSGIGIDVHSKGSGDSPTHTPSSRSRPWHDCGRQNEADKVQIAKTYSPYGFRYYLESPISTSQRREDDRITYINKGQFYGITLEYVPDPERPIKNQTVKSTVMLVFREEKSPEDEAKAWQFWHGRQHSVKQRILDADTKNSVGLVGCIEEVAHNAISIYWNPLESSAKINVAVQCLSTDFSSQKGVKGLPLHLQIDTFDDPRESVPVCHRGYCQIKVFCDKGAERKTRDEERRAAKRKMAATGRNKRLDELYHPTCERSEFYSMADLIKLPALFTPSDHNDKMNTMDLQSFYSQDHERKDMLVPIGVDMAASAVSAGAIYTSPVVKRRRLTPPPCERIMIYVRQENELVYTPLHLVPPTSMGLLTAIESKYKLSAASIHMLYRKNCKGILAKIDDDMLKHYCNEDLFIMEITTSTEEGMYDITLKELFDTT